MITTIPEVHLVLFQDGKVLLLRRFNTGYEDGKYSLVAGRVERGETAREAMAREAVEEAGLTLRPVELELAHAMYRLENGVRVSLFFSGARWHGEPTNREPDKCDDLRWFPRDALPANTVPYVRQALSHIGAGTVYSEYGWH